MTTPGFYKGRAIKGSEQYGQSSKGTDQIAVDLAIETGETVTAVLPFTQNSVEYSVKKLRACGWKGDDLDNLEGIDANEVTVEIKEEEWEGKVRMKADIKYGGFTFETPMDAPSRKRFAASWKSAIRGLAGGGQAAPRPQATPNGRQPPPGRGTGPARNERDEPDPIPF